MSKPVNEAARMASAGGFCCCLLRGQAVVKRHSSTVSISVNTPDAREIADLRAEINRLKRESSRLRRTLSAAINDIHNLHWYCLGVPCGVECGADHIVWSSTLYEQLFKDRPRSGLDEMRKVYRRRDARKDGGE